MINEPFELGDAQARFCYSMSLQTTPDIVKNGFLKLCHIEFMEFLEMIARVADIYYVDNDPLFEKINKVLDRWLPLVDKERREP